MVITHLTLSHWPYVWADAPVMKRDPNDRWPEYYLHVVRRVDQQFQDLMNVFEGKGLLENALVIVYSDHGESFGVPGEALVPDNNSLVEMMGARPQWGHGSTVLTAHQFHVVLGTRGYGKLALARGGKRHGVPASVEDITPTITALVKARTDSPFDGRSLLPLLDGS